MSDSSIARLVTDAQLGNQNSMDKLAKLARERLYAYLYRVTLDHELTEDLLQETLLQMVKSLKDLKKPGSFWPWMYRVAMGKAQHHFRTKTRRGKVIALSQFSKELAVDADCSHHEDGLNQAIRKELAQAMVKAISQLRFKHRNVLVLRCFEQRPYTEIASIMDCSRTTAQVMFFRAKQSLKKQLARQGMSKALVLPGLVLFGKLTAPSKAAIASASVTATSTEVSLLAALVGSASTKVGMSILVILAALMTTGIISVKNSGRNAPAGPMLPDRSAVRSFHFVEQAWSKTGQAGSNLLRGRSLSKGAYEQWFYFPEGIEGPMFMMMQRWDPRMRDRLCSWMQNRNGNYYFHSGEKTIYIRDYHLPLRDLRTRRLPTDTPQFTAFLDEVEGKTEGVDYTRDPETGLLTGVLDDRFYNAEDFRSSFSYNKLNEKSFDSFRYPWPDDAKTIDKRDTMHKRGWTYFTVDGHINGEPVTGIGRVPFTYDTYHEYWPWLQIKIADRFKIIDTPGYACIVSAGQDVLAVYPGGSFFKGLTQPWMGMHTIDIIRRDAAREKIKFDIKETNNDTVKLRLFGRTEISYTISLYKDLVEEINSLTRYEDGRQSEGTLRFDFLQEIKGLEDRYPPPETIKIPKNTEEKLPSITWLMELAQSRLVE